MNQCDMKNVKKNKNEALDQDQRNELIDELLECLEFDKQSAELFLGSPYASVSADGKEVSIIWEKFENVAQKERSHIVKVALQKAELAKDAKTFSGFTIEEAEKNNLLKYKVLLIKNNVAEFLEQSSVYSTEEELHELMSEYGIVFDSADGKTKLLKSHHLTWASAAIEELSKKTSYNIWFLLETPDL